MSNAKDKRNDKPQSHTGSVHADDEDLVKWLRRFWARDEFPQRVLLYQTSGRNNQDLGSIIYRQEFKPNERVDVERATLIAHEMIAAAQNDANCQGRRQHFVVHMIDMHRGAEPEVRRIGPFLPKHQQLVGAGSGGPGGGDDDEEEYALSGKNLSLDYVRQNYEQIREERGQLFRVLGDALMFYRETVHEQRQWMSQLMSGQMQMHSALQAAKDSEEDRADRRLEREFLRKDRQFKHDFQMDAWRWGRNQLSSFFGGVAADRENPTLPLPAQGGEAGTQQAPREAGMSHERILVDSFLADCDRAGLMIPLFGDWETNADGKPRCKPDKPGIFTEAQFAILYGVQTGQLGPEALDRLIPELSNGGNHAITPEQQAKALSLPGMTGAIASALAEVYSLRMRRQQLLTERQAAASPSGSAAPAEPSAAAPAAPPTSNTQGDRT